MLFIAAKGIKQSLFVLFIAAKGVKLTICSLLVAKSYILIPITYYLAKALSKFSFNLAKNCCVVR